jgi:outer membrane protein insertion porin family
MNWVSKSVSGRAGASIIALGVAFASASVPLVSMAQTATSSISGGQISNIVVEGNQRIEPATVLSYMTVSEGQAVTPSQINASVKALFETGLFRDVRIERRGATLAVMVEENPVVNQIAFEGNDRVPDDTLRSGVTSRERRVFTRAKAETDAEQILESYRRAGRYGASVEPKIIELPQNRVDLVFEIDEGPLTGVDSIRFVGNRAYSDRRLRSEIPTDESSWYNFLSSTDSYDPDRLELDKQVLRQFYLSNGYVDFEVNSAVAELSPDRSGFFLTFTVSEGEQYRFGEIDVISNAEGVDVEDLRRLVTAKEGDIYDIREIEETITEMTFRLGESGYAFTRIEPIPVKDDENNTVGITFEINEGQRVFVERIDITGNSRTLDRVVRRQFELVEGDAFNALQLRRSRSKIRGLGFFSEVDVRTREGSAPDRIVVETEVKEQSTGQLSFGVGFSTSENISGEVSIVERNLLGRGQALRVRARVSGRTTLYDLSFTEPAFLDRDLSVGFDLFRRETNNQDTSSFDIVNTGFQPRVSFPLGRYSRLSPRYRISEDEIVDVPDDASPLIEADIGSALTSSLGYEFVYDRRNDPSEPKKGFIFRLEQDIAGLGGDARYLKTEASVKGFTTIVSDDVVGSLELAGGAINSFGGYQLKASDRFFLGGDTLRGFESAGIGPRDQFTDDTLGGNYYGVARAEVTFPLGLPEEYGLAGGVFGDIGTVFGLDNNTYVDTNPLNRNRNLINGGNPVTVDDSAALRAAVGATIFWTSPFGPVRLNFAAPILQEEGDDDEFFRFSAGTRF